MSARLIGEHTTVELQRDKEGHREYKVSFMVQVDDPNDDGPLTVLGCPGLPVYGDAWLVGNDADPWAYCKWDAKVSPTEKPGPSKRWTVEMRFSTKPDTKACRDSQFEDPLLEPQKVSGSFRKDKKEATRDRFGSPIQNSAFEQIRGPQVEFDRSLPSITIEQNVPDLELNLIYSFRDHVNDAPLWGMNVGCVKLSDIKWEKKFKGTCEVYYTRTFTFDIDPDTFDRDLMDEGTKALNGQWNTTSGAYQLLNINGSAPDPNNPQHFIKFKDRNGENCRTPLNGAGLPADVRFSVGTGSGTSSGDVGLNHIEYYPEADFLRLGIPTEL